MGHEATAEETHSFAKELCRGNPHALVFCDLWYTYCHSIDDILDTMEDGRPTMSKEAILAVFINAAMLYNSPFYVENRHHLYPVVFAVTNQYADSVAWERSPEKHRRTMADVLRCCGDEMLFIVAMIVGGWQHMRQMSGRIRERDWILQHDEHGNPQ